MDQAWIQLPNMGLDEQKHLRILEHIIRPKLHYIIPGTVAEVASVTINK
jgi:hypothetical protein